MFRAKQISIKCVMNACIHERICENLFGGYATPTKCVAFWMLALNIITTLKEIITSADKRGEIDYDAVQDQMKAIYKRLKKAKKTNIEIFNEISEKVHKVSLQEDIYCQIVTSYFIAKCEIFEVPDADAK